MERIKSAVSGVLPKASKGSQIEPYDPYKDKLVLCWDEKYHVVEGQRIVSVPKMFCLEGSVYSARLYFANKSRRHTYNNPFQVTITVFHQGNEDPVSEFALSIEKLGGLHTRDACVECVSTGAKSKGESIDSCPLVEELVADYDYLKFDGVFLLELAKPVGNCICLKLVTGHYSTDPVMKICIDADDPDYEALNLAVAGLVSARRNINRSCGLPKAKLEDIRCQNLLQYQCYLSHRSENWQKWAWKR